MYSKSIDTLTNTRQMIHQHMNHSFMTEVVGHTKIDEFFLAMVYFLSHLSKVEEKDRDVIICSLLLIHHGLMVHEVIDEPIALNPTQGRQLSVLAGDFFSSKYVRLLSRSGLRDLMGHLARSIVVINEWKAESSFVVQNFESHVDDYMELQQKIYSELLYTLARYLKIEDASIQSLINTLVQASTWSKEYTAFEPFPYSPSNLSTLYIYNIASPEEKRWIRQALDDCQPDQRVFSLHVKYGTSSYLYERAHFYYRQAQNLLAAFKEQWPVESKQIMDTVELPVLLHRKVEER